MLMINGRKQCDSINGCGTKYDQHLNECPKCGTSEIFSQFLPFNPLDWIYDLECYPNIFTASFKHPLTGVRQFYEVSQRRNDLPDLMIFLNALSESRCRLIGFNNVGYDYPMLHFIIQYFHPEMPVETIYQQNDKIINTPWERRFDNVVWDSDTHISQIDLYKIHHFDNDARRTSLKMLEFNMRSNNIEDLPFKPGEPVPVDGIPTLIKYNDHDVNETEKFYIKSIDMIEFREELGAKYGKNFLNHSDKKIGTEIFVQSLEETSPGSCYTRIDGRKAPRQTIRHSICLGDIIFPYIAFERPEFNRVKQWLSTQVITETKGVFKDLNAEINGFKFDFGLGGIHGSIDSAIVQSDGEYVIFDWDVAGFYPTLGAVNGLYPEHLSSQFGAVDGQLKEERSKHKKGTPLNLAIKLARNGAYGDSNSKYSPFYDPQYTMSITINGQLLLCLLAEHLMKIPQLSMIQINTDGLTVKCPRIYVDHMKEVCAWWESYTCLQLESVVYSRMFIRDVNHYIGEYEDGGVKRKGAYEYKREWHQNHSAMIVPRAAEAALVRGEDIQSFIRSHTDIMDFMLCTKVGKADQLLYNNEIELQRITRYYVSVNGGSLTKISPPTKGYQVGQWKRATKLTDQYYESVRAELASNFHTPTPDGLDSTGLPWDGRINTKNKSKYETRRTGLNVGRLVTPCNDITQANGNTIDYDYYIKEAEKLVKPLRGEV